MLRQGALTSPAPVGYMLRRRALNQTSAATAAPPARTVTIRELCTKLDISLMTIHGWRAGSSCRRPLPSTVTKVGSANRVSLSVDEITEWLATHTPKPGGRDLYRQWISQI